MRVLTRFACSTAIAWMVSAPAFAAEEAVRIERLARLADVWAVARFLHPHLAYRPIDWDAALVSAIPALRRAENDAEFVRAVSAMLAALQDPSTRIVSQSSVHSPAVPNSAAAEVTTWLRDGVLLLDFRSHGDYQGLLRLRPQAREILQEIAAARDVVVDLRAAPAEGQPYVWFGVDSLLGSALVSRDSVEPAQRYLVHSGYRPQTGSTSGGYFSAFQMNHHTVLHPEPGSTPKRVVFLINEFTVLPEMALALQSVGDARIVAQGAVVDGWTSEYRRVRLTDDAEAWIRTSELMIPGGRVHFDASVPSGTPTQDPAKDAAMRFLGQKNWDAPPNLPTAPLPAGGWQPEKRYAELSYPGLEHRLLGAFRIWGVIHHFYPYLHLIGDWDGEFRKAIPAFENAADSSQYVRAVLQLLTHVPDGHTYAYGHPEIDRLFGEGRAPVGIRFLEGQPVITEIWDEALKRAGLEAGDVVVAVDGAPVAKRIEFLRNYLTASTEAAILARAGNSILRGPDGSTARLTVRKPSGAQLEVPVVRSGKFFPPEKSGPPFTILENNLGYVDLRRLNVDQVDPMFEQLRSTRGIVFDLRGYPKGTVFSIAPRINTHNAKVAASFRRRVVAGNLSDQEQRSGWFFEQELLPATKWKYTAPTVMLIDDRTISQAEHTGLFFEAANGTKFVGSNSAGANGDITNFFVPGGIVIGFTGHDVRHADGRQLQRIGLVPDVRVEPTIAGVRRGEDEVLNRGVQFLEQLLGKN